MEQSREIDGLNHKLVELYGKLAKIKHRLDVLREDNETQPINPINSGEGFKQGNIQTGKWPIK